MAIYKLENENMERLEETSFSAEGVREREDLQRILKDSIHIISKDCLVIAEEFSEWTDGQRRIDLLAIDSDANLVVIELKRTNDGGHMELQALRYAAMISTMTFRRAVEIYSDYMGLSSLSDGEADILNFLGWDAASEDDFADDVRIVLASADFSKEITTSVLWLNDKGLDIRCVKIKPYKSANEIFINVEQVIPLPEAESFQVKVREKKQEQQRDRSSNRDTTRRDLVIDGRKFENLPKRRIILEILKAAIAKGVGISDIQQLIPRNKLVSTEGSLSSDEFIAAVLSTREKEGRNFSYGRFFVQDNELFHIDGKTYALSKMWGKGTQSVVEKISEISLLSIDVDW